MGTLACTLLLLAIICLTSATLTTRNSALQGIETVRQAPLAIGQPIATLLSEMLATRPTDSQGHWLYTPNDAGSEWCTKNSYFELIPVHLGTVLANGSPASWKAPCFASTSATFVQHGSTSATIQITASNPVTQDCADLYVFSTSYANYWIEVAVHNSNRKLEIPSFKGNELLDIQQNGVRALQLPCGLGGTIESAIKTISLFVPGDAQEPNMIKFLVERKIFPPFQSFNKTQPLDKKLIKSGTYLSILGMDGLSALIMFGTGGRTSHSAVAVWDGPELYVCESTAMDPTSPHPWPAPWGIIRTPWDTWLQYATGMEYIINLLPLQSQYQAQFNEQRYWSWFRTVQGQPYGYHTFLFSFIDTPAKNLPLPMDEAVTGWLLTTMDRLLPNSTGELSVYSLITWGLNHRIKKNCPDVTCVSDTLLAQKMNLAQLLSQPEDDSWRYGPNVSLVCSEFAASVYKYALGPNWPSPFQATEQTPKDNYQMNIFDGSFWNSQNCPIGLSRDPTSNGTYCQIMGKWVLPLNGYNTVPIYPNMNNNCPAQWPDYTRCPAGNPKCC